MKIRELIKILDQLAPPVYAEDYDNVGLICGDSSNEISGVLCTLDCTEAVIDEAIQNKCNVVVAHHPIVFRGLKKFTGKSYVERTLIKAIKNDIAIFAIHTNLDNVHNGVNKEIANRIGLKTTRILQPKSSLYAKLSVYVPNKDVSKVEQALFTAGAGEIGNYSECSFVTEGTGAYKANELANPTLGEKNKRHHEPETKLEVLMPLYKKESVIEAMLAAHPYEEVAYDLFPLLNKNQLIGSGMIGSLEKPMSETDFMNHLKSVFGLTVVRHTPLTGRPIQKIALCGGSGSFLTEAAKGAGADAYITADVKYHEFFEADNKLVIMDIGHFESEQFTSGLLADFIQGSIKNIATFAVRLSGVKTNPINYF